jgi:hypothetical protein
MSESPKVALEYIGPPLQEWNDGERMVTLIPGRRYQVSAPLADYMVEHDTGHWKRPDPPKRETAAAKE